MEKRLKGSVLLGYMKFIMKKWGSDGLEEASRDIGLKFDDIQDSAFYPKLYVDNIYEWLVRTHGRDKIIEANKFAVKNIGMISYILKFVRIERVVRSIEPGISDGLDFGRVEVGLGEKTATVKMYDINDSELDCLGWMGALEGMLEMTKTMGVVEEVMCSNKGADHCEFIMTWE
jgi:hypothetical protein